MLKPRQRLTKRQIKEDKLLTSLATAQKFIQEEWIKIASAAGAALIIIVLVVLYANSSRKNEIEAATKLYALEFQYMERGTYNELLAQELQNLIDEYGGTSSGGIATFYLANTHYNIGNYQEAEDMYRKFLDDYDRTDFLRSSAISGIAATFEQRKMYKEASEYYLRSAREYPEEFTLSQSLLGAARSLALSGDKELAKEQCRILIEEFPNTSEARDAQILIAQL